MLFVLFYVLFVCKCVLYHCHRVLTQLQLTNISNTKNTEVWLFTGRYVMFRVHTNIPEERKELSVVAVGMCKS